MPELVTDEEIGLIFTPVVVVTVDDLPFDFDAALDDLRSGKPMPWRYTKEQIDEMESERLGADVIAPYIAF